MMEKLFSLFSSKPYWSIIPLRETLKQPDAWIRECLAEIAVQITEGTYAHQWKLMDVYIGGGGKEELDKVVVKGESVGVKEIMEEDEEEFDEDEEDNDEEEDDFEEITG
jgi:transcription initiation factor TFIIF subunit beta